MKTLAPSTACRTLLDYDQDLRDLEIVKKRLDVLEEQDRDMDLLVQEITSKRRTAKEPVNP